MKHPSYLPDLLPYDFWVFPIKKECVLKELHFAGAEEIKEIVTGVLKSPKCIDCIDCLGLF